MRVPKPSSTFSNQGGLDSRDCSTRGAGRPRVRQLGGAKARGGLGGARVRVGRGKYSPTPYFCLLVGIQRAMATTSPRGVSGCSYSRSERCCSCRTLPPCSGKTWATLARAAASPPRRPASLVPGVPHARASRSPASPPARGHLLGPAAAQPRAPSPAPPRLLPLAAPSAPRPPARPPPPPTPPRPAEPRPRAGRGVLRVLPGSPLQFPALPGCSAARRGGGGGRRSW